MLPTRNSSELETPAEKAPWLGIAAWPVLVLHLLFLWQTDFLLCTVNIVLLLFGWKSIQTARWILESDPQRPRAFICSLFALVIGAWRGVLAGIGMIILLSLIDESTNERFSLIGSPAPLLVKFLIMLGVLVILGVALSIAAAIFRIKVWVHPNLKELTEGDFSVLSTLPPRTTVINYASLVIVASFICCGLAIAFVPLVYASSPLVLFTVLMAAVGVPLIAYDYLSDRILAFHPSDCWK